VTAYSEPNIAVKRPYHIALSGSTINFYGYGVPAFKDFLFSPNSNANNKIFQFTVNEVVMDYHTLEGAGFLFNAKYTYVSSSERRLSGYIVLMGSSNVAMYRLDNVEIGAFTNEASATLSSLAASAGVSTSAWGGTITCLATTTKPAVSSGTYRYLKLVASPTAVSFYQFTDSTYGTVKDKILDNVALTTTYNAYGFGPIACYSSHYCGSETNVVFSDLSLAEDTSVSFGDLVKSTVWTYPGSLRIIANVDNDGVPDFGVTSTLSMILYFQMQNSAHYVGWGINNTISIGGYTSVSGQANGFIARNGDRGTFINRSGTEYSLDGGTTALAIYIGGQYSLMAGIDKPIINTQFLGGGVVNCSTPTVVTSRGNSVGSYEWKYLDVTTGTWNTVAGSSSSCP
jgi:hypothetical protein